MLATLPETAPVLDDESVLASLPQTFDFAQMKADLRSRIGSGQMAGYQAGLRHFFPPGLYVREYSAAAGILEISRIHKVAHPFVLSAGTVVVWTEGAEAPVILRAPHTAITQPGTRRALLVLEDIVWTTIHPNPDGITDPQAFVELVTEPEVTP